MKYYIEITEKVVSLGHCEREHVTCFKLWRRIIDHRPSKSTIW